MIGTIFGNGDLPLLLSQYLINNKTTFIAICLDEFNYHRIKAIKNDNNIYYINAIDVNKILKIIKQNTINQITMCGGVNFTGLKNIHIPFSKLHYLFYAIFSRNKGDNFLLNIASRMLKGEGVNLAGVHEIIPEILTKQNDSINTNLAIEYKKSIELGVATLEHNSKLDIGQSIVIQQERVLGIEAVEGTTELITRCSSLANSAKEKPILIKMPKIGQNMNLDMPTIGLKTIETLALSGYAGLVVKNESVIFLDKNECKELLKQKKMFLKVLD